MRKYLANRVWIEKTADRLRFVVGGIVIKEVITKEPLNNITIGKYFASEIRSYAAPPIEPVGIPATLLKRIDTLEKKISRLEEKIKKAKLI